MKKSERGKRQTFHHDLHTEVRHVPATVIDDVVEQEAKVCIDLISAFKFFIEIPSKHFNVARFIYNLSARVQLRVVPWHSFNNL